MQFNVHSHSFKHMKNKHWLLIFVFFLVFNQKSISSEVEIKPNFSVEQNQILNNSSKSPYFLIADQLKYLYPKKFITSGLNPLSQNIALSSVTIGAMPNYFKNNVFATADLENIKGLNDAYLGLYKSAIKHFELSLALRNEANINKEYYPHIHKNLVQLYYLQNDLNKTTIHNELLIEQAKLLKNNQMLISALIFKAHNLLRNGDIKQAEHMILKYTLLINNGLNRKKKEQACYLQLGKIYLEAKRYTESKWFYIQSLTLSDQLNLYPQKIESLLLLAKVKNKIKDYNLALGDLKLAKNLIKKGYYIYQDDYKLQLAQTYAYLTHPKKRAKKL